MKAAGISWQYDTANVVLKWCSIFLPCPTCVAPVSASPVGLLTTTKSTFYRILRFRTARSQKRCQKVVAGKNRMPLYRPHQLSSAIMMEFTVTCRACPKSTQCTLPSLVRLFQGNTVAQLSGLMVCHAAENGISRCGVDWVSSISRPLASLSYVPDDYDSPGSGRLSCPSQRHGCYFQRHARAVSHLWGRGYISASYDVSRIQHD